MVASSPVTQTSPFDEFASPAERGMNFDGPAPSRRKKPPAGQQDVWNAIAHRHPRKFRKALAYLKWLDRMEAHYSAKIL